MIILFVSPSPCEKAVNKVGEPKHLNIGGKLVLYELRNVKNADEGKETDMSCKQNINSLFLFWGASKHHEAENAQQMLEALKSHTALKLVSLRDYLCTQFPMWMRDQQLENLVQISSEIASRQMWEIDFVAGRQGDETYDPITSLIWWLQAVLIRSSFAEPDNSQRY